MFKKYYQKAFFSFVIFVLLDLALLATLFPDNFHLLFGPASITKCSNCEPHVRVPRNSPSPLPKPSSSPLPGSSSFVDQEDFLAQLSSIDPADDVDARFCKNNLPALPERCIIYEGTEQDNFRARWLWCWKKNSILSTSAWGICTMANGACNLSRDKIASVVQTCSIGSLTQTIQKINCVKNEIYVVIDQLGGVCRNYSSCFDQVWRQISGSSNYVYTSGGPIINGQRGYNGHAWNEIPSVYPNVPGTYYVDAYNSISFWCPVNAR